MLFCFVLFYTWCNIAFWELALRDKLPSFRLVPFQMLIEIQGRIRYLNELKMLGSKCWCCFVPHGCFALIFKSLKILHQVIINLNYWFFFFCNHPPPFCLVYLTLALSGFKVLWVTRIREGGAHGQKEGCMFLYHMYECYDWLEDSYYTLHIYITTQLLLFQTLLFR